jgi:putative selenium metabolism protein SsnA
MLLKNLTGIVLNPPSVERCDVRIDGGLISERGRELQPTRSEKVYDLDGMIVMPGFVNAHTHLYSTLSRGMPGPSKPPRSFVGLLRDVWWKLDEALDHESIYYSALVGSIDAIKHGTTTLIDHHASPNCIIGSLDILKSALSRIGVRGILCYETTDRGGQKRRTAGLIENERFVVENADHSRFRGMVGAHASFTLNDDTLEAIGELSTHHDCGVHIHVAEDRADVTDATDHRRVDLLKRLRKFGLLSRTSILAHGIHLTKAQCAEVERSGSWIVHNPRSNMNNIVGYAPLDWFPPRTALGTDGFPADMLTEAAIGFLRNQESCHRLPFYGMTAMLHNGNQLASQLFRRTFGALKAGSPADLVGFEYRPPTPLTCENLVGHVLFGMSSSGIRHVMTDGTWRVFDRQLVGIDERQIINESSQAAAKLWKRMQRK